MDQLAACKELRYASLMLTRSPAEAAKRWAPSTMERALDKVDALLGMIMRVAAAAAVVAAAVAEVAMMVVAADVATAVATEAATIVDATSPTVHIVGGGGDGGSSSMERAACTWKKGSVGGADGWVGGEHGGGS